MTCRRHPSRSHRSGGPSGTSGQPRRRPVLRHRSARPEDQPQDRAGRERHHHRCERVGHRGAHLRQRGVRRGRILVNRVGPQHSRGQCPPGWPPRPLHLARPARTVIPAVGCSVGYLDYHAGDGLPDRTDGGRPAASVVRRNGAIRPGSRRDHGVPGAVDRDVSVDGVRRAGSEVSRDGTTAIDGTRHCGLSIAVLAAAYPGHPVDERNGELDRSPTRHRARRGVAIGSFTAGTAVAGAYLRAQRRTGCHHHS